MILNFGGLIISRGNVMSDEERNKRIRKAIDDFDPPREYWEELFKKKEPTCVPETCEGQCQGMGHCHVCIDFRKEHGIELPILHKDS